MITTRMIKRSALFFLYHSASISIAVSDDLFCFSEAQPSRIPPKTSSQLVDSGKEAAGFCSSKSKGARMCVSE